MMKVIVRGHNLEMTEALKDYAEKKLSKIEKYFDNIQKVNVELDYRSTKEEDKRHVAQVTIWASGSLIRGEIASKDMYASIDMVFNKLEKQVIKYKEKLKTRKKEKSSIGKTLVAEILEEERNNLPKISKSKILSLTEMTPEEATLQMKMIDHDFFVYKNIDTGAVNIAYTRKEGDFGNLIVS
ncbi:MAG: ribosomal subunit interface protein [Candidatus Margulisbacteria bacterium GWF2_38_17]|nr:MAG: ribosomal subunit interface protein [Candidatus Margulisbacteria bacterium GWD2_39_127]OGI02010.1 MAG: ribosomal subunit interface protein [Candidatus Margulisbacteria bacterium GWF2_38_17]OGI11405.1 MAG: ribosomal subunit interface protein [Candidatus Margulisbacteria bacterium GWE2_39_32]